MAATVPFPQGIAWSFQPTGAFLSFDSGPLQARIFQDTGHIALAGPDLNGTPHANVILFAPPAVQTSNAVLRIGNILSSTAIANGLELTQSVGAAHITARLTFAHDGVLRYEVTDWGGVAPVATAVASSSNTDECFYGFGEKFNGFNQAGNRIHTLTFDNPGNKGDHSYKVAPWFVSTRGYGFHLDSLAESTFDMRFAAPDRYVITNHFSTLTFNVVYGPQLTDVLIRYTSYTGRPPLPPPFAFGPWISSDVWRNGGEVRYAVTKFRERAIPVSGFVFDSPWENAYNDFAFNIGHGPVPDQHKQFGNKATFENQPSPNDKTYDGFKSVGEMMSFLQQNGLKAICWLTPFLNKTSLPEQPGTGQNLGPPNFVGGFPGPEVFPRDVDGEPLSINWWKGTGSPLDPTGPAGRNFLTTQLKRLLQQCEVVTKSGAKEPAIGGFKPDDGEARTTPGANHNPTGEYIPLGAVYANGRTGKEMGNGYCVAYLQTVYNVLGNKGVLFARSGFTGTQAFPGCWAGDNQPNFGKEDGLPSVIIAGLSAAMSGYSIWGHDIGGYLDGPFSPIAPENLFMRWAQFGCFSPLMQMHRTLDRAHPLRQYPWGYAKPGEKLDDNAALTNYRFYTRLHTQLFPYIYTYAQQSQTTGLPIIRPLVLLHPDDAATFAIEDEYCFGNEFLVAPMITPNATMRPVYLPAGNWFDFWTDDRHTGKQKITVTNNNQAQIPLFVREGAIVPMLLTEVQTLCDANYVNNPKIKTPDDGLQFLIYPAGTTEFIVYDGTNVTCTVNGLATEVAVSSSVARSIVLKIFTSEPATVSLEGAPLAKLTGPAFESATSGWQFDAGFLSIKFQHAGAISRIRF
jgi:alpha-glucosidase (family GH31 glycosyl hydrolase)